MPSRRMLVRTLVASCALLLSIPAVLHAQRLTTEELLSRGAAAYDALPASVTLLDAPKFSEALGYLYAYEQRMNRAKQPVPDETQLALGWMLGNIAAMSTGKADASYRSDDELHDRGMAMYRKTKASESQGIVWDVPAFLSAATNLFAYLQVAPHPRSDASSAHAWLVDAQDRLVKSAGKGDDPNAPNRWMPRGQRPGAPKGSRGKKVRRSVARQRAPA